MARKKTEARPVIGKDGSLTVKKAPKPAPKWRNYAIGAAVVVVAAMAFIIFDPSQNELRNFISRVKAESKADDASAKPPFEENERRLAGREFAQPFTEPTNPPLSHFSAAHNNSLLWGSYASHMYVGMRTRSPQGVVTGLGWTHPRAQRLRVDCDQGDGLDKYGWERHDGRSFGKQTIKDGDLTLETSFVKHDGKKGGSWASRIVPKGDAKSTSIVWTIALESGPDAGSLTLENDASGRITGPVHLRGNSPDVGDFSLVILPHSSEGKKSKTSFLGIDGSDKLDSVRDTIQSSLRKKAPSQAHANLPNTIEDGSSLFAFQIDFQMPGEVTVVFVSHADLGGDSPSNADVINRAQKLSKSYTKDLNKAVNKFDKKFDKVFAIGNKGYSGDEIEFAKSALSQLLGGMAYFYGESIIEQGGETKDSFAAPLFTAVPSRSFFPRGFLWDEGFHELLIARWDAEISKDALGHWLQVMHSDGWIPREQILGDVARSKVPDEFINQNAIHANPPTLLLVFEQLFLGNTEAVKNGLSGPDADFLSLSFSRLRAWFTWLVREQAGAKPDSFYWRGRDVNVETDEQGIPKRLNPRTLASGLDDYPRALFPTSNERHVDLTSWVIRGAKIMAGLARALGQDPSEFEQIHKRTLAKLDEYHWDVSAQEYRDWGKHAKVPVRTVNNKRVPAKLVPESQGHHQFIDAGPGYVSIFPFLLKIVSPDSKQLGAMLSLLKDPKHLWSPAGIRSISAKSPFYGLGNSEHDKPYWRGQVWININYLALDALHYYASQPGPYASQASSLYQKLKTNVVTVVQKNYQERGFVFEQYTDEGVGSGVSPFTGWSTLAALIMADLY